MDDYIIPPKSKIEHTNYASNNDIISQQSKTSVVDNLIEPAINLSTTLEVPNKSIVPELRGLSMRKAMKILYENDLKYKIEGNGIVAWQSPKPGSIVKKKTTCIVGMQ